MLRAGGPPEEGEGHGGEVPEGVGVEDPVDGGEVQHLQEGGWGGGTSRRTAEVTRSTPSTPGRMCRPSRLSSWDLDIAQTF